MIDEEQGVVVSMAVIHGLAEPHLVTQPTASAFVLRQQQTSGSRSPWVSR